MDLQVEDEIYNVYDQARGGKDMAQSIYRPSKNLDKDRMVMIRSQNKDQQICSRTRSFGSDNRQREAEGPVQFVDPLFWTSFGRSQTAWWL